ncbi:MAG: V-type ATP synthase subunit A [Desulfurococcaceae archaeon TW002]
MLVKGKILRISGPLIIAEGMEGSMVYEVVLVGEEKLIGEVIGLQGDKAFIQVYEDTSGLRVGEPVKGTGGLLSAELGPGLIGKVYDGLQRPLSVIGELYGAFVSRGVKLPALPRGVKWFFTRSGVKVGDKIEGGSILGYVQETPILLHKIMVPPGISGVLKELAPEGDYTIEETIAVIDVGGGRKEEVRLMNKWPIRKPRPYKTRLEPVEPLITGTRVLDMMFPIARGGKAAVPGGFGSGKTVLMHTLTKWSRTHVNIFVGCGERGNEMADALHSFRKLTDPASGRPLSEKAIFIANTSNMPVAARETSVFLGVTIGEYFRDMGYDVLMVADSTSRWAEAMREISARLEEMPGDEGFPAYLGSRLAEFYERSGRVVALGNPERVGSLTILGAVSPPGADFSEPVTTNTLRYIGALLALDVSLANRRHFPAINWLLSYSQYVETVARWWERDFKNWLKLRYEALRILQRESELMELVRLVGPEALPDPDKLLLDVAKMIREDFLQQSAYHPIDAYSSPEKTVLMLDIIIKFYEEASRTLSEGVPLAKIREAPIISRIARMKEVRNEEFRKIYEDIVKDINDYFRKLRAGG